MLGPFLLVDIYGKTGSFDHKCHVRKDITVPFCFNTVGCLPWLQRESGIMLQLNVVYSIGKTWYTEQNKFYAPKYISVIFDVTCVAHPKSPTMKFRFLWQKHTEKNIFSLANFLYDHYRKKKFSWANFFSLFLNWINNIFDQSVFI